MTHSSTIAKDALFFATHPSRETRPAETILTDYDFARDDETTRIDFKGVPSQLGMKLTRKGSPSETLLVICIPADDSWYVCDMTDARYEAGEYIAAVKLRIEANRARCEAVERPNTQTFALAAWRYPLPGPKPRPSHQGVSL